MKKLKITKEQILNMNRKAERDIEIESGARVNHHRVWQSQKAYKRKPKHKKEWAE